MKEYKAKYLNNTPKVEELSEVFIKENINYQNVDIVNWEEYSYKPKVKFAVAYTEEAILLHYIVEENTVRAVAEMDNGKVWEDSCVEFFSIPADDNVYYNIECNCAGKLLIGAGENKQGREHAPQEILDQVKRFSSLGNEPFEEKVCEKPWDIALIIPYSAFFKHNIDTLKGKTISANFYKCGDECETMHFLSWNAIDNETPNFHLPKFFGKLTFKI